ncbi:MAG: hypothetical protein C4523_14790 [Myxococcales bacterium]|nr:MAG: hypothetical protein C4523_14790 [Myxococcales bacterium]
MSREQLIQAVLDATPREAPKSAKAAGLTMVVLGLVGLGLAATSMKGTLVVALYVSTVLMLGLGVFGAVLSAIFQLTGARWGRSYRRLAEAGVVFMPLGVLLLLVVLATAGRYLPWAHAHHLTGGKHVWLTRPFWDLRVLAFVVVANALGLRFVYLSLRRDFCVAGVGERFKGKLAAFLSRDIRDPAAETARCEAGLTFLAPIMALAYAFCFTFLAFDLIMALEYDWFSTLFGAWYFIGHLFSGVALLAIVSILLRERLPLAPFMTDLRQRDLATLLFAFVLVNTDFFWSQYLTIWYGNLPEETHYLINRTREGSPYAPFSNLALYCFFAIPFAALLFRKVKQSGALLPAVAAVVALGVFLARFLEIAPPLLHLEPDAGAGAVAMPLAATLLVYIGCLGAGYLFLQRFLTQAPILPIGDEIFIREHSHGKEHA